jgi:hypothetical protein
MVNIRCLVRVISGLDVIDKIAAIQVDERQRPLQDLRMTVTVEELPRKKITELYGYHLSQSVMRILITGANGLLGCTNLFSY